MPVRIHHIHKQHQPGDLASFSDAETDALVRGGIGLVEDPQTDVERDLFDLQKTLPPRHVPGTVAEIAAPLPGIDTRDGATLVPRAETEPAKLDPPAAPSLAAKETPPAPKPPGPATQGPQK